MPAFDRVLSRVICLNVVVTLFLFPHWLFNSYVMLFLAINKNV